MASWISPFNALEGSGMNDTHALSPPARRRATCLTSWTLVSATAALLLVSHPAGAASFDFVLLDTLGGTNSQATDINNSGQVVGNGQLGGNLYTRAAWWDAGHNASLLAAPSFRNSLASGLNDAGQIVGTSPSPGAMTNHATLWIGGTATDLGTLGGTTSRATDINNAGQVSGASFLTGNQFEHATLWNGTVATDLGTLGGRYSEGAGLNDAGQVVGWSMTTNDTALRATLWNGTTPIDLGGLGGQRSTAFDINNLGQIVGSSLTTDNSAEHAVWWNGLTAIDLGTLGGSFSRAVSINEAGQIVGSSAVQGSVLRHATLWDSAMNPVDLNSFLDVAMANAGWVLDSATAINDAGWITGVAHNQITGAAQGYVLSPSAVPEPSTNTLLLAGLGVVGMALKRKRQLSVAQTRGVFTT
jgi:probable HAF family extracellular repeat protein